MNRALRVAGLMSLVCPMLVVVAAGCGGGGSGNDVLPDVVIDVPGDAPGDLLADVPSLDARDPGTGEDVTAVDPGTDSPDVPASACTPACVNADGKYCDETAKACKSLSCTACTRSADCAGGGTCLDFVFDSGVKGSLCSKACTVDADCPEGFACAGDPKMCHPRAQCPATCAGSGALGDACSKDGVNAACGACGQNLTCIGSAPIATELCQYDRDCVAQGIDRSMHPDCVGGACGSSICASSCVSADCPEGYVKFQPSFAACWCVPAGKAVAGAACPVFNVNVDADSCAQALTCLGIQSKDTTDACTVDTDCSKNNYYGNPQCVAGHCGTSFCSPLCDADGACAIDYAPMDVSGTCYCIPLAVGNAGAGAACPIFNVNATADYCQSGLECLGIEAKTGGTACTQTSECSKNDFNGNPECKDGFCGTSFCAAKCDSHNRCSGAYSPIQVGTNCFCEPVTVGTSTAGQPCPFSTVHAAASACAADLTCLGIPPSDTTKACTTGTDCPASDFFGNGECAATLHCGGSFCAPYCDDHARCGAGFQPALVGMTCLCIPTVVGTSVAFAACPMGASNATASACAANLVCLGVSDSSRSALCAIDADCLQTNADCQDGLCGYSYCSPYCDDVGACATGTPFQLDTGTCLCAPAKALGASVFGDACPNLNVNLAAPACQDGLTCAGLWSVAQSAACTTAVDCPATLGVPWDCRQGHCGYSWCAVDCDAAGTCPTDDSAYLLASGGSCTCQKIAPGTVTAGQACAFEDVNLASGACATGLACIGLPAVRQSTACTTATDCAKADFRGTIDCVSGFCGSSFCAAPCATGGKCGTGFEPLTDADGKCWCQPVTAP